MIKKIKSEKKYLYQISLLFVFIFIVTVGMTATINYFSTKTKIDLITQIIKRDASLGSFRDIMINFDQIMKNKDLVQMTLIRKGEILFKAGEQTFFSYRVKDSFGQYDVEYVIPIYAHRFEFYVTFAVATLLAIPFIWLYSVSLKSSIQQSAYKKITHDIKTPLAILETMKMSPVESLAVKRLRDIINSVQPEESGNSGKEIVDLHQVLQQVVKEVAIIYPTVDLNIDVLAEDTKAEINRVMVMRAMTNVILNACEASIDKHSSAVKMKLERGENSELILSVKDEGRGIPKDILKNLGKKQITYNKYNGTGLGVLQVFETMKFHDGKIDIQTQEGVGSKISMIFSPIPRLSKIVIDDDPIITRYIQAMKSSTNDVLVYNSFADFQNSSVVHDVKSKVYIDFHLKNENGLDVARKLKKLGFVNLYLATSAQKEDLPSSGLQYVGQVMNKPALLKEIRG
jgi:two-component sensor histidine kinase